MAERIVEVASSLPGFQESVFATIIANEDKLLDIVMATLTHIEEVRKAVDAHATGRKAADFEVDYRRTVSRRLDYLELFGLDRLSSASRRHRLSLAYITLELSTDSARPDATATAEAVLAPTKRLLVKGPAGSGKTTLLQWVAVRSAEHSFKEPLQTWNGTVPLFLQLRAYADQSLPSSEEIVARIAPAIVDEMPKGWVHDQLRQGSCVVLVDGVDETPTDRRQEVKDWLGSLVSTFPNSRYIVTSRPTAVEQGWLREHDFVEAELQEMDVSDTDAFIDHWHSAVRDALTDNTEREMTLRQAHNLKSIIRSNRPLRLLATSPLLCAMMCALHRDRDEEVPNDRLRLYEAACEMLLDRRDLQRKIRFEEYPKLTYTQQKVLLRDLAYWMLRSGILEIDLQRANQRFDRRLKSMTNVDPAITGAAVRTWFVERSGLIHNTSTETISFRHKTFQEYLAAEEATDEDDVEFLVDHAHDDTWGETIVMAAGKMSSGQRRTLLTTLLERGDAEPIHKHRLHMLAVACLDTAPQVEAPLQKAVPDRLADLIPPNSTSEALQVARAGELAVPFLKVEGGRRMRTQVACIRALGVIGGEAALDTISGYAKLKSRAVVRELLRNRANFDRPEYTQRVLARVVTPNVTVGSRNEIPGLKDLPNLQALTIGDNFNISDFRFLLELAGLRMLDVGWYRNISNLACVSHMKQLADLRMGRCSDPFLFSIVAQLPMLRRLHIRHDLAGEVRAPTTPLSLSLLSVGYVGDIRWLPRLPMLVWANVGPVKAERLPDLSPLTQIKTLQLKVPYVKDLSPLSSLQSVEVLELSAGDEVVDLSPLLELKKLRRLKLVGMEKLRDLRLLADIESLNYLTISESVQTHSDLPPRQMPSRSGLIVRHESVALG